MERIPLPTQQTLRENFIYNPATGELVRIIIKNGHSNTGYKTEHTYERVILDGQSYYKTRVIWMWMTGEDPGEMDVDHINHVRDDNRWENLQLLTHANNTAKRVIQTNNTTGVRGVSRHPDGRFLARATLGGGKRKHLGYYDSVELAEQALIRYNNEATR